MPKTRHIKVYQFSELSDRAKEKAREWYRQGNCDDTYWSEATIEDAATIAEYLGIDLRQRAVKLMGGGIRYEPTIYWSGFWSQGDGACFEGTWQAADVKLDKLKEYAPQDTELHRIGTGLADIAKEYPEASFSVKHRGHYSHEFCTEFDVGLNDSQEAELEYDSPEWKVAQARWSEVEEALIELARDFMRWIYKQLNNEYDYQNADEQVDEAIKANEYEFLEDGSMA